MLLTSDAAMGEPKEEEEEEEDKYETNDSLLEFGLELSHCCGKSKEDELTHFGNIMI